MRKQGEIDTHNHPRPWELIDTDREKGYYWIRDASMGMVIWVDYVHDDGPNIETGRLIVECVNNAPRIDELEKQQREIDKQMAVLERQLKLLLKLL